LKNTDKIWKAALSKSALGLNQAQGSVKQKYFLFKLLLGAVVDKFSEPYK